MEVFSPFASSDKNEIQLEELRVAVPDDYMGIAIQELFEQARLLTSQRQRQQAIIILERAAESARERKDREREATALSGIGLSYEGLGQSLAMSREVKDRKLEGIGLYAIGEAYLEQSQYNQAIHSYEQALFNLREVKDRRFEIETLYGLMAAWNASGGARLAIFYGKQAVNTVQSIRSEIRGLSNPVQLSFRQRSEKPYRTLAELLISQGRLAEAEQVLGLLKEEEYFEFLRRDAGEAPSFRRRAEATIEEAEWEKRYREIEDHLVAIATRRGELRSKSDLSSDDSQKLAALEQDLVVGNLAFEKFLGDLAAHFSAKPETNVRLEQLRESQGIQADLRELPPGTVAIYTLVGEDKYRSILVTPDVQKAYEYPINSADLNRKVLEFHVAVQDPKMDPRPMAEQLHKILLGGMAEDLRQAKAKTLMWSLDGSLRYLPIAALFDGRQYLIENFRVSVFTPASNARLKDRPNIEWSAAGFGVTKSYEGASALRRFAAALPAGGAKDPNREGK